MIDRNNCQTGKIGYENKQEARVAIQNMNKRRHKNSSSPLRSYVCPFCSRIHLTSQKCKSRK